jgi:thiol:disulfide interchange protein DsbD
VYKRVLIVASATVTGLLAASALAQQSGPNVPSLPGVQQPAAPEVELTLVAAPSGPPGGQGVLGIGFAPPEGVYIDRRNIKAEIVEPAGWSLDAPDLPKGEVKSVAGYTTEVFTHEFVARFPVAIPKDAVEGQVQLKVQVSYVTCTGNVCQLGEKVMPVAATVAQPPASTGGAADESGTQAAAAEPDQGAAEQGFADRLSARLTKGLSEGNWALVLALALVGGMLLALTPCVLPMVPIVVSVLVGGKDATPTRRVISVLVYVLGLSLVYATLGLVAALTGGLIGSLLQNTVVLALFCLLFVALALSMFGLYDLEMPPSLRDKLQVKGGGDLLSALLMGLISGIIASPCIGPVIAGVLGWIASTRNAPLGFTVLFTMGWGLGLPFIVAALAGSTFLKPGPWMERIKKFLGLLLLVGAAYFANLAIRGWLGLFALAVISALIGIVGLIVHISAKPNSMRKLRTAAIWQMGLWGIVIALGYGLLVVQPEAPPSVVEGAETNGAGQIAWHTDVDKALALAKSEGKPAMIDFTAEWCIPCREMDASTFANRDVIKEAKRFVAIKADLTKSGSPQVGKLIKRFNVYAPPVVIFVDSSGKILDAPDQRVIGLTGPEEFLRRMKQIR